ncbi:MAG: C69 family dipeptidase [Bacteroidales bacterium]|nr:C69 family dipeptidase [Bacteroidales bacterium]NLM93143.1 dipeptidase [Bacteroidales bacterium]
MKRSNFLIALLSFIMLFGAVQLANACTNVLVSRGASADGSVMISYLADSGGFMDPLYFSPAKDHAPGETIDIYEWDTGDFLGSIPQVAHTYRVIGNMNEHQVAIGETTFTGRRELTKPNGILDYGSLMYLALQRATTAREAIKVITDLIDQYGYASTGESFSVADKEEVWLFELIGKGEHGHGAVWVAARVPEGYVTAHANTARIRQIDFNDTQNWMWSKDVVDFAREMNWFSGRDRDFSFADTYAPASCYSRLLCEGRVWSVYRRVAPSANFAADFWRCAEEADPYPLFIKPDKKISNQDMMALVRDHFQDTPYDMTKGFAAGPHGLPYRWRPLGFQLEGDETQYAYERPISQQQTAFSFVAQSRNWLPDEVGGIFWYGVDDTYSTCYMPLYMGMEKAPVSLVTGTIREFDWNSAFWVFNLVSNYAYGLYEPIIGDILKVQKELEDRSVAMTKAVDQAAQFLAKDSPEMLNSYLTDFSVSNAEYVVERWRELGHYIFAKYNDRYIHEFDGDKQSVRGVGYDHEFNRRAVEERPGYYDVKWRKAGEPIH